MKNNLIRIGKIFSVAIFFSLAINSVWAGLSTADFNYINDFMGDRATGLGGAYTAISDDPSGAYYNPAGLAFAYDNQISLSVNSLKVKKLVKFHVERVQLHYVMY